MKCRIRLFSALLGIALLLFASNAFSAAQGPCVECHTMHNSQNGTSVTGGDPTEALLNAASCVACHTGENDGTNNIPYVMHTSAAYGSNTLAGGNFRWVAEAAGDVYGHNVEGVTTDDDLTLASEPPGWDSSYTANGVINDGAATWGVNRLTCAGTNGCHGDRVVDGLLATPFAAVSGAHHADDSTIDGTSVAKSYRFLKGIKGIEDSDWEYTVSNTDHNQYKGSDDTQDSTTISYLCAECHGKFHTVADGPLGNAENGVNPWLRHPTDFDMNDLDSSTEYYDYGGDGVNNYVPEAPVASNADPLVLKTTVFAAPGDAIVTCISCHRAHGSPYEDLLRWDYNAATSDMVAGSGNTGGCFHCHTTKN